MIEQAVYVLWDERDGLKPDRFYLDRTSAEIALHENYSDYWIRNKMARVNIVKAVSYSYSDRV